MNYLQLILATVTSLATVIRNPALGGGSSLQWAEAAEFLNIFGELLSRGEEGEEELRRFQALVQSMATEGRPPTVTEWAALRARDSAADEVIDRAVEKAQEALLPLPLTREELLDWSVEELIAKSEELEIELNEEEEAEEIVDLILAELSQPPEDEE